MEGVSIIICAYNSTARLKPTLAALAAQEFRSPIPWEIVLVDNASTDGTAEVAREIWDQLYVRARLRIVREQRQGQVYAREKGLTESRYSIVLFCDDDNWLCRDYVQGMYDELTADTTTVACGGRGIAVFESAKPGWFEHYQEAYATGAQDLNKEEGRILSLYGAGLAVRKAALEELYESGFTPLVGTGRKGSSLGSADDIEMTNALVLQGYRLAYRPQLTFFHFLPQARLTDAYRHRLFIAFGKDGPVRNLYYAHLTSRRWHRRVTNWYLHLCLALVRTASYLARPPKPEGRYLNFRWNMAYLRQLLAMKKKYRGLTNHLSRLERPQRRPATIKTIVSP